MKSSLTIFLSMLAGSIAGIILAELTKHMLQ
nr:MAG TPA: YtxH-like protein [Caudoviricetes sp.]